ncbi:MAG: prolyl oligopeptidase family serine peptidase [Deltaproteobacteria bacterium]|nr:prolyl oligopeptidase family serine peptidase [Deltaproteobacteria bacterium]
MAPWRVSCRRSCAAALAALVLAVTAPGCATRRARPNADAAEGDEADAEPWLLRRARPTTLVHRGPAPGSSMAPALLPGMELVYYPSAARGVELSLLAVIATPRRAPETPRRGGERLPAVMLLHAGTALTEEHLAWAAPFVDAGLVVLLPTWRGENGNPGEHELLAGELEDAMAAARWLAVQPDVDVDQLSVFGAAEGGALAALLALDPEAPFATIAAVSAVTSTTTFARWQRDGGKALPFDVNDPVEQRRRALLPNAAELARPLVLYVGQDDVEGARDAQRVQGRAPTLVELVAVPGDATTAVAPALARFLAKLSAPTTPALAQGPRTDNSIVLASDPSSLAASRPRSVATATALRGALPSTRLARDHRSTCPFAGPTWRRAGASRSAP